MNRMALMKGSVLRNPFSRCGGLTTEIHRPAAKRVRVQCPVRPGGRNDEKGKSEISHH